MQKTIINVGDKIIPANVSKHMYGYRVYTASTSAVPDRINLIGNISLHQSQPINSLIKRYVENIDGTLNYWLDEDDSRLKADTTDADLTGVDGNVQLFKPAYWFRLDVGQDSGGRYVDRWFSLKEFAGATYRKEKSVSPFWGTFDNVNNRLASVCSLIFNVDGSIQRDAVTDLPDMAANAAQFRGGDNTTTWDDTYRSHLGRARTNVNRATLFDYHYGDLTSAAGGIMSELAQLWTLEYCNYNSQAAYNAAFDANGMRQGGLGNGPAVASAEWNTHNGYYPFIPNGVTAPLGNQTGQVDYVIKNWQGSGTDKTVTVTSWRGLELWFEYLWLIARDHLVYHQSDATGGKVHLYVCEDYTKLANPATDQEDGATPVVPDGYELRSVDLPAANGYGWNEVENTKGDMYPINTQGSATQGLCDYYYRNPANRGWFAPQLAGSAPFGSHAGVRIAYTYNRVSYATTNLGFRLCRHNPEID
jgi:hypothetical protein